MSGIDYGSLRSLTARRLVAALLRDGFTLDQHSSSHRQYRHPDGRRVTVSFHRSGQTFTPKILQIMLERQARWSKDDLLRLGLL